jgi:hypothetical protein
MRPVGRGEIDRMRALISGREQATVSAVLNGFFRIDGFNQRLRLDFYLWLRENYGCAGGRVALPGAPQDARLVSAVVHRLLTIYDRASGAMPMLGISR